MTQGEVKAFWSGVAATSKGKILAGIGGGECNCEPIPFEQIDEILNTLPIAKWVEDYEF